MPAAFPALTSGVVGKYPITRGNNFRTQVYYHVDLTEQRFTRGPALADSFVLVFNRVTTVDKEIVRAFFDARRGAFDTTWTLTLADPVGAPTIWGDLQFLPNQNFEATETSQGIWSFELRVRQTR